MSITVDPVHDAPQAGQVLSKAVVRAAGKLGLSQALLGKVIGLSPASVSRLAKGRLQLARDDKAFELALLLVRLYRALDAILGGDERVARRWMTTDNTALGATPLSRITSIQGLVDVVSYLDARRARV